jgi:tRNA(Ile)-lysidine synthase
LSTQGVDAALWKRFPGDVIVAYSGGADSTALLLMAQEALAHPAMLGRVSAVHVHHGLQAAADDFAAHCEVFCRKLGVPLQVLKVQAHAAPGQSPEDAARKARYQALSAYVLSDKTQEAGESITKFATKNIANVVSRPTVLLAQHADDQVETLLLALSRGAGVDGLAGMAAQFERFGVHWARPFISAELSMGAQEIRAWLAQRGLQAREPFSNNLGAGWVEDPTNSSPAFTRNRIRAELIPVLERVFPQYRDTFARTARNMAIAGESIKEFAIDLIVVAGNPPRIAQLRQLSAVQQTVVLRHWLKTEHQTAGSEVQLQELLKQIAACSTRGHAIDMKFAGGRISRQGDVLAYVTL